MGELMLEINGWLWARKSSQRVEFSGFRSQILAARVEYEDF